MAATLAASLSKCPKKYARVLRAASGELATNFCASFALHFRPCNFKIDKQQSCHSLVFSPSPSLSSFVLAIFVHENHELVVKKGATLTGNGGKRAVGYCEPLRTLPQRRSSGRGPHTHTQLSGRFVAVKTIFKVVNKKKLLVEHTR